MSHIKCEHARNWKFFLKTELSKKNLWPLRSPGLTPADFFLWGLLKGKCTKIHPAQSNNLKTLYAKRFKPSACRHFGKSIPEFGETHSSVLGFERRLVSASIMSRSCFASFPICVYKFSTYYLNNINFIDNSLGPLATEYYTITGVTMIFIQHNYNR